MRRISHALVWVVLTAALFQSPVSAQKIAKLYVIAHVDIAVPGGNLDEPLRLLREFVADSQKDAGAVRVELLQQDNRHNHFTIVEVWQTRRDFDAHSAAEHTKQFREKIQPMLGSPFDERLNSELP